MRTVILVPCDSDGLLVNREYWANFCWRVRRALERDGIQAKFVAVEPKDMDTIPRTQEDGQ